MTDTGVLIGLRQMLNNLSDRYDDTRKIKEVEHFKFVIGLWRLYKAIDKSLEDLRKEDKKQAGAFDVVKQFVDENEKAKKAPIFEFQKTMEEFLIENPLKLKKASKTDLTDFAKWLEYVQGLIKERNSPHTATSLLPSHLFIISLVFLFNVLNKYDMLPTYIRLLTEGVNLALGAIIVLGMIYSFLPEPRS